MSEPELTTTDYVMAGLAVAIVVAAAIWVAGFYESTYTPMPDTLPPRSQP